MALSTSSSRMPSYIGNGAANEFAYTFKIFAKTDLRVTVKNVDSGVETTLTVDVDYTVAGVGLNAGGSVVLIDDGQAWLDGGNLADGYTLTPRRVRPITQTHDFRNQRTFFPKNHENSADHLVMIDQQQQDELDRSLKLAESDDPADFDTTLPPLEADEVLAVNADGDGFTTMSLAEIVGAATIASGLFDDKPAAPSRPMFYEATDHDQIYYYSTVKAAWRAAF